MIRNFSQNIKSLFRPLLAIVILYFLFKSGLLKLDQIKDIIQKPGIIFWGLTLLSCQFLSFAIRWQIILKRDCAVPFLQVLKFQTIGQFFNLFIPGGVGGDFVKALEISKYNNISNKASITSVLLDRVMGLYCMILFSLIFLFLERQKVSENLLSISVVLFIVSTVGLFFSRKILSLFIRLTHNYHNPFFVKLTDFLKTLDAGLSLLRDKKSLAYIIAVSFLAQCCSISFLFYCAQLITTEPISYLVFFPLACFSFMASSIPITPGGIGFGQAAFYIIFKEISPEVANAVVLGITLLQIYNILISLPGAYFFTRISKR